MSNAHPNAVHAYVDWIIARRWLVLALSVVVTGLAASGASQLTMARTYRAFFAKDNPQLLATEAMEAVYSKDDSQVFIVHNPAGSIFAPSAITAILELTEAGWQTPYSTRVDSITNYQHSWAEGDDLVVEDLIPRGRELDEDLLQRARAVTRAEPALFGNLVSRDEDTTLVAIRVAIPVESAQVPIGGTAVENVDSVAIIAADSRRVLREVRERHPELRFELTGTGMLQAAFAEAPPKDGQTVFPAMFVFLTLFLVLLTRSLAGTVATLVLVLLSGAVSLGATGFYGYTIDPVVVIAPMIVLTLAVADAIHILSTLFHEMRGGSSKNAALRKSLEINAQAVFLTSLTTIVGFLVMNFSDAPPFRHLGNVTATGVGAAWLLSMTFLPAALSVLPLRVAERSTLAERSMQALARFTVANSDRLAVVMALALVVLVASATSMEINDYPHRYFDDSSDFRRGTDLLDEQRGFFDFKISVRGDGSGGINEPAYLEALDRFEEWLRTQPGVVHVSSYAQIIKRLNRNMHGDDPAYYRVPAERDLAAQYLVLYEMSLPFGLDLNDRINVDKSATKVDVLFQNVGLADIKRVALESVAWMERSTTHAFPSAPTSYAVMYAYIFENNISSMVQGTLLAFLIIAGILFASLRSAVLGAISLIPNLAPAAAAFGIWALLGLEGNFAVSVVGGLSLGIVVDNTVHFLSKYARARQKHAQSPEEAVEYAFVTVGPALVRTSIIVVGGFGVLMLSNFYVTVVIGALTSLTVLCALATVFLLLPPLLIRFDRRKVVLAASNPARA